MAPPGDTEYDDLLWPLMRLLEEDASADDLEGFLHTKLERDYDLRPDPSDLRRIARQIKEWFATGWPNTTA